MTQFCGACDTANRDSAKYCRGCAARLTPLSAPPSDGAGLDENLPPAPTHLRTRRLALPGGFDPQVGLLLMLVVLSFVVFLFWYWNRPTARSAVPVQSPQSSAAVYKQQGPSTPATLPMSAASAAPVSTAAAGERPAMPASALPEVRPETQPVAAANAGVGAGAPAADGIATASRDDEDPREEVIVTDNRRSTRATRGTQPRTEGAAAPKRLSAQGHRGAARTPGGTGHCDRYNPWGEAIC